MSSAPGHTWGKKRVYSVIAKPIGKRSGGKLCSSLFSASESAEEAMNKVLAMAVGSPRFREVWAGYQFLAVDLSETIEVNAGGIVQRHINERVVRG